ncbi:hypothetical protein AB4Y33_36235, partial [Paraburkholderia sp. BR14319]
MSRSIQTSRAWRTALSGALAGVAALAFASAAQAQVSVGATASIAPGAATSTTGALTVNETAGVDNAQANQLTITTGNVS